MVEMYTEPEGIVRSILTHIFIARDTVIRNEHTNAWCRGWWFQLSGSIASKERKLLQAT